MIPARIEKRRIRAPVQDLLKVPGLGPAQLVQLILLDHVIVGESERYSDSDARRLEEFRGE